MRLNKNNMEAQHKQMNDQKRTSRVDMLVKYVVHAGKSIIFTQSGVSCHRTTGLGH